MRKINKYGREAIEKFLHKYHKHGIYLHNEISIVDAYIESIEKMDCAPLILYSAETISKKTETLIFHEGLFTEIEVPKTQAEKRIASLEVALRQKEDELTQLQEENEELTHRIGMLTGACQNGGLERIQLKIDIARYKQLLAAANTLLTEMTEVLSTMQSSL